MADVIVEAFEPGQRNSEAMITFGGRLYNQWSTNAAYRRPKELTWLEDLRSYKGIYDPDVQIAANNSKAYPKIIRSKVNIVLSRLHEMLFPETERNFSIKATPEPSLPKSTVMAIAKSMVKQDPESGEPILPTADELQLEIKRYAKKTADKMFNEIDDQLLEMGYSEETKQVLRSGLMYGTGIMKGPMVGKRTKRTWHPVGEGSMDYREDVEQEDVPDLKNVRIWDWYPDMSVTEQKHMSGSFQRHIMTKHDLRMLMKRDDFYSDIISEYLKTHPSGDYVALNWEVDLQVIEVEAGSGKAGTRVSTAVDASDASRSTNRQLGKKYQVIEYWGYVDGSDLAACGIEVEDVKLEYAANVWMLGKLPIKAVLYEGALNQYKLFYYEKDETSIFGEGLSRVMRGSQIAIAAGARMVLDNAAVVAGPQVEVNWSLMTPDTDLNSFYARKIWFREGKGIDAQYPALRVHNIDSHVTELLTVIEAFKQFGDEETTLPTWMIGQMVNNETAQATSGRLATITVSIKDIVKNFDTFTEGIILGLYAWNMEFNPRTDIKGDYTCKARGVSSLVMKEIRMQALDQLTTTLTPEEWEYMPRREFLKDKLAAHDIFIELLTEQEVAQNRKEREESVQAKLDREMQRVEIDYKKGQTLSQLSKAKKSNSESVSIAQTADEEGSAVLEEGQIESQRIENEGGTEDIRRKNEEHNVKMATSVIETAAKVRGAR